MTIIKKSVAPFLGNNNFFARSRVGKTYDCCGLMQLAGGRQGLSIIWRLLYRMISV
jgi:hypothetical protein